MRLTPEKIAEWKSLVPKLNDDSDDHMDVAHSADMAPQHTVNFRHAKNAHEAAWAINSLIADLEEAREQLASPYMDGYEAAKEEHRPQIIALEAELATVRKELDSERLISKQLAEHVDHWRANHDNVVAKLRLFTQREDLPVDRLPAYEYVVELEKQLAEANNRERLISKNLDFERELHAKTETELAATRKKLAESERRYSESVGGFKRDLQQKLDDQRSKSVRLKAKLAEAQSRDGSIAPVAAIKFSLKTDCGDQFLRCWVEGNFDAIRSEWPEAPEAVFIGADPLHPNTQQTSTASLDAAIAEAIEPYRKDAACWQFARKELCWSRSGDKEAKWVMYIEMDAPTITAGQLRDDSVAESLDAAVLAAIAAKGESECPS